MRLSASGGARWGCWRAVMRDEVVGERWCKHGVVGERWCKHGVVFGFFFLYHTLARLGVVEPSRHCWPKPRSLVHSR
jgi:hypothetical protein